MGERERGEAIKVRLMMHLKVCKMVILINFSSVTSRKSFRYKESDLSNIINSLSLSLSDATASVE